MKWGLSEGQYLLLENLVVAPLKQHQCRVYIFGSRARGVHHPHSDVDLLFATSDENLPSGVLSKIREDIEESRFPFTVDLVNEAELADSYRPSVFLDRVEL